MTKLGYDENLRDWTVNGKSLLSHLARHEGIDASRYQPACFSQPRVRDRLLGKAAPDLLGEHIAIYLCSHCGGYDGAPIGIKLIRGPETFEWTELGLYSDADETALQVFSKVTEYCFPITTYTAFLENLAIGPLG
jgi:hypothetical protein